VPYATPERHLIKESSAIYKKAWVAVPVARPTLQGVSHCLPVKDEQRRSPRRICVQSIPLYPCLRTDTTRTIWIHIPMGIYRCFVIWQGFKFARLWRVKRTKRL